MNYPKTKRIELTENISGFSVSDPYRWLEDGKSQEVKNWIAEQNSYLDKNLDTGLLKKLTDVLVKNYETTTFACPTVIAGKYFYFERQPQQNQPCFYMSSGLKEGNSEIYK